MADLVKAAMEAPTLEALRDVQASAWALPSVEARRAFNRAIKVRRKALWLASPKRVTPHEWRELEDTNSGLCLACGEYEQGQCEPDAEGYPCGSCRCPFVVGVETARMLGFIEVSE